MHTRTIGLFVGILVMMLGLLVASSNAQCPPMPAGTVCLTQAAANVAAANSRENVALKTLKIPQLEEEVRAKEQTIRELKDAHAKNTIDLIGQMNKATAEAAFERGRAEQLIADKVFWSKIVEAAINNTRKKCVVSVLFC
jgi:NaMN:DMB phosphoribosyltransferase